MENLEAGTRCYNSKKFPMRTLEKALKGYGLGLLTYMARSSTRGALKKFKHF
jgi:hypothetical protein